MRRLAFALTAALVAGPAAAQPGDDAIAQLLSVPPPAAEPAASSPTQAAGPESGGGPATPATTNAALSTPAAAPSETVSTAAPAASSATPAAPPALAAAAPSIPAVPAAASGAATTSAVAAAPAPVTSPETSVPPPASPAAPALAAAGPPTPASPPALASSGPGRATAASTEVSPAQAAALQAAVMASPPAPPAATAPKDPPAPSPAYSALSSASRPTDGQTIASGLAGPAPAGDADEDSAPARQNDSVSSWSDVSSRSGQRSAYGRYGVARPGFGSANPGLPYTRYSQVTRPVQLAETGVSADQPMTAQDLAYESRMRQAFSAAENAQGPMDGHWLLTGPEGRLYAFQVVDRGQTLEGVWTDLRRPPGSLETAGLIEQLSRDGDSLTVRFTAPRRGGPVTLILRSAPGGMWTGQMTGASGQVTLRRD